MKKILLFLTIAYIFPSTALGASLDAQTRAMEADALRREQLRYYQNQNKISPTFPQLEVEKAPTPPAPMYAPPQYAPQMPAQRMPSEKEQRQATINMYRDQIKFSPLEGKLSYLIIRKEWFKRKTEDEKIEYAVNVMQILENANGTPLLPQNLTPTMRRKYSYHQVEMLVIAAKIVDTPEMNAMLRSAEAQQRR